MGQHDALDGYVTCLQLRVTRSTLPVARAAPSLEEEAADFSAMLAAQDLSTADPLGLGGLMADAYRLDQLARDGALPDSRLRDALLRATLAGLEKYAAASEIQQPAERRLAFRELGMAIGLHTVASMRNPPAAGSRAAEGHLLETLRRHDPLRDRIVAFWLEPEHQRATP
jgi:hypothetical protein